MTPTIKGLKTCLSIAAGVAALGAGLAHATHSWNGYHWASTSYPMPLVVNDSVTNAWQFEFDTAISEWNQSTKLNMSILQSGESNKTRKRCPMVSGQIRVCNADHGFNGWLGLATIGLDNQGHIDQGTAEMNDSYSSYWDDPNEKRHVMCQEIGHTFGLAHTSEDGSSQNTCMDYSNSPTSISPNAHDYEELDLIYNHTESYNSYASGGGGGSGGGCNAPPGKGCNKFGALVDAPEGVPTGAIRVHASKFEQIWVKSRADGGYWIFHVRLAPLGAH